MSSLVNSVDMSEGFDTHKANVRKVIIHNGWEIIHRPEDKKRPYEINHYVGGIMGYICFGFETLEQAMRFAETEKKD